MNRACKEKFEALKNDVNILFDNIGGYLKESLQSSTEWFNHKVKSMFVCGKDSPTLGDMDQDLNEFGEDVKTEFDNFGKVVKEWGENLRENLEDWAISNWVGLYQIYANPRISPHDTVPQSQYYNTS